MATFTDKLKLEKPLQDEKYNVDVFNANSDKIDAAVKEIEGKVVTLNGAQTIEGAKTFTESPKVPDPTEAQDVANKGFVEKAIQETPAGLKKEKVSSLEEMTDENALYFMPKSSGGEEGDLYDEYSIIDGKPERMGGGSGGSGSSDDAVLLTGDQTISGVKTFETPPVSETAPVAGSDLVNKDYADTKLTSEKAESREDAIAKSAENPNKLYYWDDQGGSSPINVTSDTPIKIVVAPTRPAEIPGMTILWVESKEDQA